MRLSLRLSSILCSHLPVLPEDLALRHRQHRNRGLVQSVSVRVTHTEDILRSSSRITRTLRLVMDIHRHISSNTVMVRLEVDCRAVIMASSCMADRVCKASWVGLEGRGLVLAALVRVEGRVRVHQPLGSLLDRGDRASPPVVPLPRTHTSRMVLGKV